MTTAEAGHRETGEHVRARVMEVALELIAEQGFAATSTREISERLGFTKAALYYHFRTKDDLLAAIVAPVVDDLVALVENASPAATPAVRRRLLERYVDLVASHEDLIRVLSADPSVRRHPVVSALRPRYGALTALLAGTGEPDVGQRTHVRAALGAVHAALVRSVPEDDRDVVRAAALVAACGALGIPFR